jgi:hypothetical protein
MNEGVKRLAILLGSIPALPWFIFSLTASGILSKPSLYECEIVVVSTVVVFIIPFGLVYGLRGLCGVSDSSAASGNASHALRRARTDE